MRKGLISIVKVASENQLADMLTKPQPEVLFVMQREEIMQWQLATGDQDKLHIATSHLRACDITSHERDSNGMGQRDCDGMIQISRMLTSRQVQQRGVSVIEVTYIVQVMHVIRTSFRGCQWPVNKDYGCRSSDENSENPERRVNLCKIGSSSQ